MSITVRHHIVSCNFRDESFSINRSVDSPTRADTRQVGHCLLLSVLSLSRTVYFPIIPTSILEDLFFLHTYVLVYFKWLRNFFDFNQVVMVSLRIYIHTKFFITSPLSIFKTDLTGPVFSFYSIYQRRRSP